MATNKGKTRQKRAPATPSGPQAPQGPRIIGKVRRGHVASTFGAGAVVDLRAPGSGAPLSGLVAGLEEWDAAAPRAHTGVLHSQCTNEPRLQRRLSVAGFRLPPVTEDTDTDWTDVLPVVRFPQWLQCPKCERLGREDDFSSEPRRPERWCNCTGDQTYAVPVRLIVACEDGHLDEFPWQLWIGCQCQRPQLRLETKGAGLAGKLVLCLIRDCQSTPRSLEGVFGKGALASLGIKNCRGRRPWLPVGPEPCTQIGRVVQRGASTVYYPVVESALDIPPFSSDLSMVVGPYWNDLADTAESDWPLFIKFNKLVEKTGKPVEVLMRALTEWKRAMEADSPDVPLEWAEYLQLVESGAQPVDQGEFQTRPEPVPPELGVYLDSVVLARRLREVRAHVAFTRVKPPSTSFRAPASRRGRLSERALSWLPAIELRGEGVFLRFSKDALEAWEVRPGVIARAAQLTARRPGTPPDPDEERRKTSPRFLLLHTFAHGLMRQLSLSCGYSSAALRERLYVDFGAHDMAGVLIHTGSADSEGTLGGLVRQGNEERLENSIRQMLASMSWCSSDPLCITGVVTLSSPENLAACHSCLLAPETSCQHFNLLLDRAMLIGTPEDPEIGYFHQLHAEVT